MLNKVVQRYMVQNACRVAYEQTPSLKRASSSDFSLEAIQVVAKHLTNNSRQDFTQRKAFISLVKKVKKLVSVFKKAPKAWQQFKAMLGITTTGVSMIGEIDNKLGNLLEEGKKKLGQLSTKILKELPMLRLLGEVLEEKNRWEYFIDRYKSYVPEKIRNGLERAGQGVENLGAWLDGLLGKSRTLRALSGPIKIYIMFQIWDWFADFNFKAIISGFLGTISWTDLIAMLPGEGLEIILELILPPPTNGALVKLIFGVGLSSVVAVILVSEVKYLMKVHEAKNATELLAKLEAMDSMEEVSMEDYNFDNWPQRST